MSSRNDAASSLVSGSGSSCSCDSAKGRTPLPPHRDSTTKSSVPTARRTGARCLPLTSHVQRDDLLLQFDLLLLQELHFPILNGIGPGMPSTMCTTAVHRSTNSYDSSANMGNSWQRMRVRQKTSTNPEQWIHFRQGACSASSSVISCSKREVVPGESAAKSAMAAIRSKVCMQHVGHLMSSDVICLKF